MIDIIYKDTKDWQRMTKRQDLITKSMIIYLINSTRGKGLHCFTNVIIDFLIMEIQTKWRGVEWAQPKCPFINGFYKYSKLSSKCIDQIYTLCIEDLTFKYTSSRIITNPVKVANSKVVWCCVCWKFQKISTMDKKTNSKRPLLIWSFSLSKPDLPSTYNFSCLVANPTHR